MSIYVPCYDRIDLAHDYPLAKAQVVRIHLENTNNESGVHSRTFPLHTRVGSLSFLKFPEVTDKLVSSPKGSLDDRRTAGKDQQCSRAGRKHKSLQASP